MDRWASCTLLGLPPQRRPAAPLNQFKRGPGGNIRDQINRHLVARTVSPETCLKDGSQKKAITWGRSVQEWYKQHEIININVVNITPGVNILESFLPFGKKDFFEWGKYSPSQAVMQVPFSWTEQKVIRWEDLNLYHVCTCPMPSLTGN